MLAEKQFRSLPHAIEIQRTRLLMYITPPERRYYRAIDDSINVCLLESGITRVKVVSHSLDRSRTHVSTDVRIDRITKFFCSNLALDFNASYLTFSMYASVCAARSVNVNAA